MKKVPGHPKSAIRFCLRRPGKTIYLAPFFKEKDSLMIFSTRDEIPKFTSIEIEPFTFVAKIRIADTRI